MITCILNIDVVLIANDYKMLNAFESVKLQIIGNNSIHCNLFLFENHFNSIVYYISLAIDAFIKMMTYRNNGKHPRKLCIT